MDTLPTSAAWAELDVMSSSKTCLLVVVVSLWVAFVLFVCVMLSVPGQWASRLQAADAAT